MNYRHIVRWQKLILLVSAFVVPCFSASTYAKESGVVAEQQQQTVTGTVVDEQGQPIPGANVLIKGTTQGVATNFDGKFTIEVPAKDVKLQVSFMGFITQEVSATAGQAIVVNLKEDKKMLEEVVVVGYGVTKKANLTGSVASVDAKVLETRPVQSVSAALAGQMPGVTVVQTSGKPGSQTGSITVRGKNTINSAGPLVIVDGIPATMDNIDMNDIASISVLKDASSAAIYGVQAANGVILITTKKGNKDAKATITYSGNVAWTTPTIMPDYLGSADYAILYNEANYNENPNAPVAYSEEDIRKFRDGSSPYTHPNTDWYSEAFKKYTFEQHHHVGISGGSAKTTYNASLGLTDQDGMMKGVDYKRYNVRIGVDSEISKWFQAGVNLSGHRSISNTGWDGPETVIGFANRTPPTFAIYNEDGSYAYNGQKNALAHLDGSGFRKYMKHEYLGIVYGQVNFMKNLTLRGVFSVRHNQDNNTGFARLLEYGSGSQRFSSGLREGYNESYYSNRYTTQLLANYNETWGKHNLAALFGFEQFEYTYEFSKASRKGGGNDELQESLNTLDASSQKNEGAGWELARRSVFGRLQYNYAGKYLLEANVRYDGSSRFTEENRWGVFPAFSAGWRISEENFMKSVNWISNMKLRAGWGQTGNEELRTDETSGYYPGVSTYAYDKYVFGNTLYSTAKEAKYVNSALTWATIESIEGGLEMGFLENKLNFELAVYKKETKDMLLKLPVQGVLGMEAPYQNAGSVRNIGFDLTVSHNNTVGSDFRYDVALNLAYVKNEIKNLEGTEGENPDDAKQWYLEGESIGSFYGYKAIGFFQNAEDLANSPRRTSGDKVGDIKYADISGPDGKPDGKIDGNDRQVIGKNFPTWTAGLSANLKYKNWNLSLFFQGAFDVENYFEGESSYAFYNGGKVMRRHLDRWTPENPNASYPRMTRSAQNNFAVSSFWVENTSYVRLKNLTFGYNLPKRWTDKASLGNVNVYFAGENLFTITNLDDWDPESPTSTRGWLYSNVKKFSLGLKVSF